MEKQIIMRNLSFLSPLLIPAMLTLSCGTSLQVSSDHDSRVDFSKYKTFQLYTGGKNNITSLNLDRIHNAVRTEMHGKGFTEDAQSPDLLVNTSAIVKNNVEVSSNTNYYGYGGVVRPYYWGDGMGSSYTTYDIDHYKTGSLIIDIIDASTKKLVWQGVGNSKLDKYADNADSRISGAINKIMENFPPKPGQ